MYFLAAALITSVHDMAGVLRELHHLGILFRSQIHEIIVHRILRLVFKPHLIMEMRTG